MNDLISRIQTIILEIQRLCQVCYPDHKLPINYLTIFAKDDSDFTTIKNELNELGVESIAKQWFQIQTHE